MPAESAEVGRGLSARAGPMLTIAFISSRIEPHFEWFWDSLCLESAGSWSDLNVIAVDFYANQRGNSLGVEAGGQWIHGPPCPRIVAPKPCLWQGPHRRTKENWFAAGNARNTAICYAPDGWIAFVDDLTVLMPGWLARVRAAMAGGYIIAGSYQKVFDLQVSRGVVESFRANPGGMDSRVALAGAHDLLKLPPNCGSIYGCSMAAPVEAFLKINGWCEDLCGGLGFEDAVTSRVLTKAGWPCFFDRRMLTLESEEGHSAGPVMRRADYGVSPRDKSHETIERAGHLYRFGNYFHLAQLRADCLAGKPFPIPTEPREEWYTGTPLPEL